MKSRYRKRHRMTSQRVRRASKVAGATFVAIIAVEAGLLAITGYQPSIKIASVVLAVTVIASIVAGAVRARLIHLPDIPVPAGSVPAKCKICSAAELAEANSLAAACYRRDAISDELVEQWRLKNPNMFACVLDERGTIDAAFGIMPLTKSFMDQFIVGKVVENQIGAEDIHGPDKSKNVARLYISGVVVRDAKTQKGHMRAALLMWATIQYLVKLYGTRRRRTLYALAATREGERLLKRLNFTIISPAGQRSDEHNLYSLEWSRDALNRVRTMIPDYRSMCTVELK